MATTLPVVATPVVAAPAVSNVRLGQHPDRTRVVVDLTEPADYNLTPQEEGRRLVIELPETEWSGSAPDVAPLGLVNRVTQFRRASGAGTRIVLDIEDGAEVASDYILPPDAGRSYRLVVDLRTPSALSDAAVLEEAAGMAGAPAEPQDDAAAPGDMAAIDRLEPVVPDVPRRAPAPEPDETTGAGAPSPSPAERRGPVMMAQAGEDGAAPAAPLADAPPPISLEGVRQSWSGYIQSEVRLFPNNVPGKSEIDASLAAELRYEAAWNNGLQSVTFVPFGRLDMEDSSRTHADIRELKWRGVFDNVEMRVGIDRVFWGVTESVHLVNIINQIDGVEDVDEEDMLGQPMASLSWTTRGGTFAAFFLPYFRERTFPSADGRPARFRVADEMAMFGSPHDDWRTDWALRYAHSAGPFDIGIAHFHGMGRAPYLMPVQLGAETVLVPRYEPIDQTSVDLQGTFGALLLKFEGISTHGPTGPWGSRYWAAAGGFEYTLFNILGGNSDLGFLAEYMWDERGQDGNTPFEDDLFVGLRWSGNNVNSTELLAGAIIDMGGDAVAANIEASRRLWRHWRISLDARLFLNVSPTDRLYQYAPDDFLQLRLDRYF